MKEKKTERKEKRERERERESEDKSKKTLDWSPRSCPDLSFFSFWIANYYSRVENIWQWAVQFIVHSAWVNATEARGLKLVWSLICIGRYPKM